MNNSSRIDSLVLLVSMLAFQGCGATSSGEAETTPEPGLEESVARCGDESCDEGEGPSECPSDCLGIEWIDLEGGAFAMGSKTGPASERPVRNVTLESFRIMKAETTLREYRACVDAGECTEPSAGSGNELCPPEYCNWGHDDREEHPINCISWNQARAFCVWAGGRLPTEAEWEYAARGRGGDATYPWGNEPPSCAYAVMGVEPHFVGCREERTFSGCSKTRGNTEQGLCDMSGNVIEWVEDEAHETYEDAPSDGSAWVTSPDPETRVARGGSIATSDEAYLRATARYAFDAAVPRYVVGVRCAR